MLLSQGTNEEHYKQVIIQERTILAVPQCQVFRSTNAKAQVTIQKSKKRERMISFIIIINN